MKSKYRQNRQKGPTYSIAYSSSPSSCIIKIENKIRIRGLCDSGAEVSLLHKYVYNALKNKQKLNKRKANIQSVSGNALKLDGLIELDFEIGGVKSKHTFYVSPSINRKLILGRDWLIDNGIRLYFDLGCIRINNTYVPLQDDIHITSVIRAQSEIKLAPQTQNLIKGKVRNVNYFRPDNECIITAIDTGFFISTTWRNGIKCFD